MMELAEFNSAMMKNFLAMKQGWPLSRTPVHLPVLNTDLPIPLVENRIRVQGGACIATNSAVEPFLRSGIEELRCVLNIAEVYGFTGGSVLDWGVGCGRMSRHLPESLRETFEGVDVDPVNVGWCQENIPWGRYSEINQRGRLNLPDQSFNLVYSYSVFTHLSEADQDHWLQELARVCRGVIVVSVHGLYSAAHIASWAVLPEFVCNWLQQGFQDAGISNPDISDVVEPDYYRDVAHTPAYIRDHWSEYVEVLDIIPGGIGKHHDAIVCRPKGDRE
jgi:2-polyprenyl-3-methyl-5-hydroxy-6-metoxy-1,4-benzoquinol methylase